jgi:signal transduction histidine kinase
MSVPIEPSLVELPAFRESTEEALRQAVEQERLALAQTLHDGLCQSLSGIRLIVALAEKKAQRHPELAGDLIELHGMVRTVCEDVHTLVEELRKPPTQRSGSI